MYTGADLQNVCREAALVALRTRILGPSSQIGSSKSLVGDAAPPQEPVVSWNITKAPVLTIIELKLLTPLLYNSPSFQNASDFRISLASVKPSLTAAMLLEYSATGQRAF